MKMNHPEEHAFHEYLDHALSESERASFEMHLESCELCRRELEELKALFIQIESIEDVVSAKDLSIVIVESLPKPTRSRVFWQGIALPLLLSALIVFAARAEILASIKGFSFPDLTFQPGEWILDNASGFLSAVDQFITAIYESLIAFEIPVLTVELSMTRVISVALGVAGLALLIDLLYLRSLSTQKEV